MIYFIFIIFQSILERGVETEGHSNFFFRRWTTFSSITCKGLIVLFFKSIMERV